MRPYGAMRSVPNGQPPANLLMASFPRSEVFEQVCRFLGGQAGQLRVGHQRRPRRLQFLYVGACENDLLVLAVAKHHPFLVALQQQTAERPFYLLLFHD